jgi:hypothetical protein
MVASAVTVADIFRVQGGTECDIPGGEEYICLWGLGTGEDDTLLVWLHVDLGAGARGGGAHSRVDGSQCLGHLHNGSHSRHHCQRPAIPAFQVGLLLLLARPCGFGLT